MKSVIDPSETRGTSIEVTCEHDTRLSRAQAFEIVWPYVLGVACGVAEFIVYTRTNTAPPEIRDLFAAVAGISGVFAGFMLAAAAILATIGDRPFVRAARRHGIYAALVRFLFTAMKWSVAAGLLSVPAMLYDPRWNLPWYPFALAVWAFVVGTAVGATVRALRTFSLFMRHVSED